MGHTRIRLRDIAERTGFSTNTVSLALRESPRIPEATRAIIRKVADELNYMPNRIAQSLVSQRSMMIGLVLPDLANPVLTQVAAEASIVLAEAGYATMFTTSTNSVAREAEMVATLRERQCDGVLVFPVEHATYDHLTKVRGSGYPLVSFVPGGGGALDTVSSDDEFGAAEATRHLIGLGRRKIALIDAASSHGNTEKRDGYLRALAEAGITLGNEWQVQIHAHGVRYGIDAMETFQARGLAPDAVLASNDSLALGVELWCQREGKSVPGDIALVGFDDIEFARFTTVPVTTIAYPVAVIVRCAVERLMELIAARDMLPPPEQKVIQPELLVRSSTAG